MVACGFALLAAGRTGAVEEPADVRAEDRAALSPENYGSGTQKPCGYGQRSPEP